jgi:DNA-binding GntR family transcriptional regulator
MNGTVGRSNLASEAYRVVRERILRGELVLGPTIPRRRLAAEFGMSFVPVSAALLRLELDARGIQRRVERRPLPAPDIPN